MWEYSREQGLGSTLNQDWDDVVPDAIFQIGVDRDGRDVGKPCVDLIATYDIPIAPVRDVGTIDVEVTPSNAGLRAVEKPTFARTSSGWLWWVHIAAWKSTSCEERARERFDLREGLGWGRDRVHAGQGEAQHQGEG